MSFGGVKLRVNVGFYNRGLAHALAHAHARMPKGGKPKDKRGGGQKMAYREERDVSEEEEEEEEEEVTSKSAPRQNPNAGMMPPSDDDEDEEEEKPAARQNPNAGKMPPAGDDDDDEDDGPSEIDRLKVIFNKCKVPQEIKRELAISLLAWKKNQDIKPKAPPPKKKQEESDDDDDDDDDDEPDPAIQKKLEEVRKRREMQAKQRIAADGWDRLKPMAADNHPPDMAWPPPGGVPAPAEIS